MLAGPPKDEPQNPGGSSKLRSRSKTKNRVPKVDPGRGPPLTLPPLSRTPRSSRGRRPPTFGFESLIGRSTVLLARRPPSPLLSLVELPGLIAQYGPGIATGDSLWMEGPGLVASALGAHIPVTVASGPPALPSPDPCPLPPPSLPPPPDQAREAPAVAGGRTGGWQESKRTRARLTGPQVVELLAEQRRRRGGALEFYYLTESCGDEYRPYDLEVVRPSRAGPDHYVFSPNAVLQVTPQGPGALVSPEDWCREARLWGALRTIPFFRDYGLHRAFTWWRKAVSRIVFQRKCDTLQDTLLIAVPRFRHALVLLTGVNQELAALRLLPSARRRRSYAPREFRDTLLLNGQQSLEMLETLLRRRAAILAALHQECYQACQDLQLRVQRAAKEPTERRRPRHLHLARRRRLEAELERAGRASLALGRVASLANRMTVQGLCSLSQREVNSFLDDVIERRGGQQAGLFRARLALTPQGGLAVDPALQLFQDEVQEALLGLPSKLLQVCDSCGLFLEITDSRSPGAFQGQCGDINHAGRPREGTPIEVTPMERRPREGTPMEVTPGERRPSERPAFSAVLPWSDPVAVQGRRLRGCCAALSRSCLERQLAVTEVSEGAARRWAGLMQEAQAEVQRLCGGYAWLADVRSFTDQWGPSSSLRGLRGGAYEALVGEVRRWSDRVHRAPRSFTTADRLVVVDTSGVLEELGVQLGAIEEEIFSKLVEELRLQSEDLVTQLRSTISGLSDDPRDLRGFARYATMVKRESSSSLMRHRMESLHSLQCAVISSYGKRSCQEGALEEQIQSLWASYVHLLKAAEQKVLRHLPSMSEALERSFAALVGELSRTVSAATAAATSPFLDPGADAREMCAELRVLCTQVHAFGKKIMELDRVSEELRGHPLDLTVMATDIQKLETLRELWELLADCRATIQEWGCLPFAEFEVAVAREKVGLWKRRASSLVPTIPTHDAVLQEILGTLEPFSKHLPVLEKLCSPTLKEKHIKSIFKDMGLLYIPATKLTVTELMSMPLGEHLEMINKMSREGNMQCDMEEEFRNVQFGWEAKMFQISASCTVLIWQQGVMEDGHESIHAQQPPAVTSSGSPTATQQSSDAALIITGLQGLRADAQDSVMALSSMLWSPFCSDFRPEVECWARLLQDLEELLEMLERYQETWALLTKMLNEAYVGTQLADLQEKFQAVDISFKEIIFSILSDHHVLNIIRPKRGVSCHIYGDNLHRKLLGGLTSMEAISTRLGELLNRPRGEFPRLCFLSDREVMKLLASPAAPDVLLTVVGKCFQGVRRLELDYGMPNPSADPSVCQSNGSSLQATVLGVFGSLVEHVRFLRPVEPTMDPVFWLCAIEEQLQKTMMKLTEQCAAARYQLHAAKPDSKLDRTDKDEERDVCLMVDLLCHYPLQCLLVAEETLWCVEVLKASQIPAPDRWKSMQRHNSSRLQHLCRAIREGAVGICDRSPLSHRVMFFLQDLVYLTMNHAQRLSRFVNVKCELEASFEWQSMMKYHINSGDHSPNTSNGQQRDSDVPACYVDVLGSTLMYGYEYLGPEHWTMVHTPSTDRAILGILLALTSYRCGLVSGPSSCGKRTTVGQLGRALGRHVVTLQCCSDTGLSVIRQVLSGALQSGAYLVLRSVDMLSLAVQAVLGQHLADIRRFFSGCQRNTEQRSNVEPHCPMSFAGESFFARVNYGCILISSKDYACNITDHLRETTRSVALAHPDYRTITEVLLLSSGFTEAISLSRRLVTLFEIAKDSGCLPKHVWSSWLLVLRNLIAVSAKQSFCKDRVSFEGTRLATYCKPQIVPHNTHPQNISPQGIGQVRAIVQGVLEENAAVNAIYTVLLPALNECGMASEFRKICEETFPTARSLPFPPQNIEEKEQNLLKIAITEEITRTGLFTDTQTIFNVIALHETLKSSKAVLLLGPSGCGKTTCYRVLASSLRKLAARAGDVANEAGPTDGKAPKASHRNPVSMWSTVETVVLFPNAMSHQEFFGGVCEERGWRDGAFTKVLREAEHCGGMFPRRRRSSDGTQTVKWVVIDGEPLGQPGWLDHFSSMSSPEDPALRLPTGERVLPGQSALKLLAEFTDLSDASPSAVTRCSVMYFTAHDLWKSVWKAELDALGRGGSLDQRTLAMWNRLAEDLFSRTLQSLEQNNLTCAMYSEVGKNSSDPVNGLREVMSFIRILRALLEDSGVGTDFKDSSKPSESYGIHPGAHSQSTDELSDRKHLELQTRNIFLLAYIWGFGAHLHPRHWPQFDQLARQVLFDSRYSIEVPGEEIIFEHFFSLTESTVVEVVDGINGPRCYIAHLPFTTIPEHQKHAYLLHCMLEACQPVLLVGEDASGRTSLCRALLSANRAHVSLPSSIPLSHRDVRSALHNMGAHGTSTRTARGVRARQSGPVLFVDDLHYAPRDVFGKASMALETLRMSMSMGGSPTPGCRFKLLVPGPANLLATCTSSSRGEHGISSRLSRLFSPFVLPALSGEVLFSIHVPALRLWLKDVPRVPSSVAMARCVISATKELYHAVREHFPPMEQRPHFLFSHHDLQKIFQGMTLCRRSPNQTDGLASQTEPTRSPRVPSEPLAALLDVAHLWSHECLRTFGDRLCYEEERQLLLSLISRASERYFTCEDIGDDHELESEDASTVGAVPTAMPLSPGTTGALETPNQSVAVQGKGEEESEAFPTQMYNDSVFALTTLQGLEYSDSGSDSANQEVSVTSNSNTSNSLLEEKFIDYLHNEGAKLNPKEEEKEDEKSLPQDVNIREGSLLTSPQKETKPFSQIKTTELPAQPESNDSDKPSAVPPLLTAQYIQHMLDTMDQVTYGPSLSRTTPLMSKEYHPTRPDLSYQRLPLDELIQRLSAALKESTVGRREACGAGIARVHIIHRQRAQQLLHILRALLVPGGHGVLLAAARATGRRTNVRLAARMAGCPVMEVHRGNEDTLDRMLQQAGRRVGGGGGDVVMLVHQDVSRTLRDRVLGLMAHGTGPGLYSSQEMASLVPSVSATKEPLRAHMREQAVQQFFRLFQRTVHVFLLMPICLDRPEAPADSPPDCNLPQVELSRALSLGCCVELYLPWSREALVETAAHHLTSTPLLSCLDAENLAPSLSSAMAAIHLAACRYAAVWPGDRPFGPGTYLEFTALFLHLADHLRTQGLEQANRVGTALARLEVLNNTALQYRQEVERLQEEVGKLQQQEQGLLRAVEAEEVLCEEKRRRCVVEERNLHQLEEQRRLLQEQIDVCVEEESPLLHSGLEALRCLRVGDLEELRGYREPPQGVVRLLDALCVLFNRPCGWDSTKQLLGQLDFYQELEFFDRSSLSDSQLQQLGEMVAAPYFLPEAAREVSRACESLCRWSRAVHAAALNRRRVEPLEASRRHLLEQADRASRRLGADRKREEQGSGRLREFARQLTGVRSDLGEQNARLAAAQERERQVAVTVAMTESHHTDWTAEAQEVQSNRQTLPGDALIMAAVVCYLGPFSPPLRAELLGKWRLLCQTGELDAEPLDPRAPLFTRSEPNPSDPPPWTAIPLAERLERAVCRALGARPEQVEWSCDRLVVSLLLWGHRDPRPTLFWPLLADAQGWDREDGPPGWLLPGETYDLVVCADHPQLLSQLDSAEEKGLRVLVSHAERAAPSPRFLARLVRSSGAHHEGLTGTGVETQRPHPDFSLVLCTGLPLRLLHEMHPWVLRAVRVVDVQPGSAQLRELMLGGLQPSEGLEPLVLQHSAVQKELRRLQESLREEQAALMDYILGLTPPLSEDPCFPPRLLAFQETSVELRAQEGHLAGELQRLDSLLAAPQRAAALAALLYQALQDVSRLSPAYRFTLQAYLGAMRGAAPRAPEIPDDWGCQEGPGGAPGQGCTPVPAAATREMAGRFLELYRPCLSQSHAGVLELLAAAAALRHDGLCSEPERAAFLRGLRGVGRPAASPVETSAHALPDWIPEELRADLSLLEQAPPFQGLLASLAAAPREWQEYLRLPSLTATGEVAPCPSHAHLTLLQRGLLWRTVLPGALGTVAQDLASCVLGPAGDAASSPGPDSFSRFLTHQRDPVVVTVPSVGGGDPLHLLRQLASQQDPAGEVHVEVISLAAGLDREFLLSVLRRAATEGHWLVLNDCHLLDQWDDKVAFYINQLFSRPKAVEAEQCGGPAVQGPDPSMPTHPLFRLWFVTRGAGRGSVPAWVRARGLPVVCDGPRDLREELSLALRTVTGPPAGPPPPGRRSGPPLRLLLRCALTHAVLLRRRAFLPSGHGGPGAGGSRWGHDDLLTLVETFSRVSGRCRHKMDALENLVGVVYGGHVSALEALEEVGCVARALLRPLAPPSCGGPECLISIIHPLPKHHDPAGLLQSLEQRVRAVSHHAVPRALGLSPERAQDSLRTRSHALDTLLLLSQTPSAGGGRVLLRAGTPDPRPGSAFGERLAALGDRLLAAPRQEDDNDHDDSTTGPIRDFLWSEWVALRGRHASLLTRRVASWDPRLDGDLSRLERRAELIAGYLCAAARDPPLACRLVAFSNPRGFLAAVRREAAQRQHTELSLLTLDLQVLRGHASSPAPAPGSVYLCGLQLRGASWDAGLGAVRDAASPQPCCPSLVLRATPRILGCHGDSPRGGAAGPDARTTSSGVFRCPLHAEGERGGEAQADPLAWVPLASEPDPGWCRLRGVRLVSTL